jgi:hypothetical protein
MKTQTKKGKKQLTEKEKKQLVDEGKKLDPEAVELKARKIYGKKYREKLAEILGGTSALYSYAFSGKGSFYKLYEINEHLKSVN